METQIDKKLVRKKAKQILKQGIAKQQTYEQLIEEFGNQAIMAQILKRIPSKQAWKKYGIWNYFLAGLMILLIVMMNLVNPSIGVILWYGLPTIAILRKATRFYFWVLILAGFGTIGGLVALIKFSSEGFETEVIIKLGIFLGLLIPAAFLAIWLPRKLTPEPNEEREIYDNEYGERRSRIIYKFIEE